MTYPHQPTEEQHLLLTFTQAARRLQISVDSLRRRADRGDIATVRIGRRRLVAPADLDTFITQQREEFGRHAW